MVKRRRERRGETGRRGREEGKGTKKKKEIKTTL